MIAAGGALLNRTSAYLGQQLSVSEARCLNRRQQKIQDVIKCFNPFLTFEGYLGKITAKCFM